MAEAVKVDEKSLPKRLGSKRYRKAYAQVDPEKKYTLEEALELLKAQPGAKFDESIEFATKLGIDPKKSDQLLRGAISLPKGVGKTKKVVAFAEGAKADEAKEAGADEVGSEDLAKKITGGWTDFDVAVATPDMMKHVGKLGKVLGPQGKMPTPKSGTVTGNIGQAVKEFKAGKVEFRTDSGGNVHALVGKKSFSVEDLAENVKAFVGHLQSLRPAKAKGEYMTSYTVATTMGPGVTIQIAPGA